MKLEVLKFLIFFVCFVDANNLKSSKKGVEIFNELVKKSVAFDWEKNLGPKFAKMASYSKTFGKYAGPVGLLIVSGISLFEKDDTKENLKNITNKLEDISKHLDGITKQIDKLDAKLDHSVQKIITEVKFQDILRYTTELNSTSLYFESIIDSFVSDTALLIKELDQFLLHFRQNGFDKKLVSILNSNVGFSNSIADEIITLSRSYQNGNKNSNSKFPQSSTMQNIFDINLAIFMDIIKANIIQESAVNTKMLITGNIYKEDRQSIKYRKNDIYQSFFNYLKKTFDKLNDNDMEVAIDYAVNGNSNQVRMINVLHVFWALENELDRSCNSGCGYFKGVFFNRNGCYGYLRNCIEGFDCFDSVKIYYQFPQTDRIYDNYEIGNGFLNYFKRFFGKQDYTFIKPGINYNKLVCGACKCTCDHTIKRDTIRKIYRGRVMAPENYVVTGIRFIQSNKAIYPQIEVGKLLPMGMIDRNSIHWVNVPTDNDFATFNFDYREMIFMDLKHSMFPDAVVTGVQFREKTFGVVWTIYGQELDFNNGILGETKVIESSDTTQIIDMHQKIPGLSSNSHFTKSQNITKIKFSTSNEREDFGQSFVPYFDGNAVSMDNRLPLSGIGLIHYTNDNNYAGYIRPVIRSLDYRRYFSTSYEPDEVDLTYFQKLIGTDNLSIV